MKVDLFRIECDSVRVTFSGLMYGNEESPYIFSVYGVIDGQRYVKHADDLHKLFRATRDRIAEPRIITALDDAYLDWQLRVQE